MTAPSPAPQESTPAVSPSISVWYERLLDLILRVSLVVGGIFVIVGSALALEMNQPRLLLFYALVYGLLLLITFTHSVEYFFRAGVFLLFLYILGFLSHTRYFAGIGGTGLLAFFAFSVLSAVLLGRTVGFMALGLSVGTAFIFSYLYASGHISPPPHLQALMRSGQWLGYPLQLLVFGTAVIAPVNYLLDSFRQALQESEQARAELEAHQRQLHTIVEERTRHLERRTAQLRVAAEVARDAALAASLEEVLDRAVNLIRDQFGFYHAGLFLLDEHGEYAVLRAATGEAGRQMLESGHRLKVGEVGIVGYVTGTGQPRIALDVGADAVHFKNPLLPETRSELALPLKVGDRVIGALDVQSVQENAFDEEDIAIFQVMADQLAVAIERMNLFEQMRSALEQRLQAVVLNTPVVLFTFEQDGAISLAQGKGLELIGWEPTRLVGSTIYRLFEHQPGFVYAFEQARAGETFSTTQNLGDRLFECIFSPLVGAAGKVEQVAMVAIDVTDIKQTEAALRRRNRLLTALHETAVEIMQQLETSKLLEAIVARAAAMVDTTHGYVVLMEPDRSALVTRVGVGIFADRIGDRLTPGRGLAGRVWECGHSLTVEDYQTLPNRVRGPELDLIHSMAAVPLKWKDELIGVIGLARTEYKPFTNEEIEILEQFASLAAIALQNARLFEEVQQTAERLREADRLKSEFLMHVSHELRSPLSSIIGYAEFLLMNQQFDQETQQDLEAILHNGQRLLNMINDLLDLAKIEAGQMTLYPQDIPIAEVLQDVERTNAGLFRRKRKPVRFEVSVEGTVPPVYADRTRLNQVLTNLISNAYKFTEEGTITLRVYHANEHVCFEVRDTGIGIPPEELPHIFQKFHQIRHQHMPEAQGSGIGLAIVHHLVELQGGTVEVQSEVGKGSVFTVRLPAARRETAPAPARRTR